MHAAFDWLKRGLVMLVAVLLTTSCSSYFLADADVHPWEVIQVPVKSTLSDIAFTQDANHGWIVGSRNTLLETQDGGSTWQVRELALEDQSYTFTSVDFAGNEGWVSGLPSVLLHTGDGGKTWESVPLSKELPGSPFLVTAVGNKSAEMATDIGAIYRTEDGGRTWKALVQGAVGVVRNMVRSDDGRYVAVSSRGNFYSTWAPGQDQWIPHNRQNSRRLQNMGFDDDGKLWVIARGGQVRFSNSRSSDDFTEALSPEFGTSWGLLDMAFRTANEIWITGGGGNLLCSFDGGKTWLKDKSVGDVPSNFYRVKFLGPEKGFILGQDGTILKYQPEVA
ncbi:photosynthesis system II assembly factor Ycf48 [Phormidium tenue]|uniref:Photosystem II assembly protein Ycf48 n=1 Tax=Phormidium tenue NIES-30 TaxID=549789 RepID=A0A1U7J9G4_9CYAN|nr:photosynthesis system II assembly factor Ycf48 [Phormidium tenue]MBD2230875.1 photosynthesis system II assembly factor Ycf48 [Phormidium tenue FACHB-1052]OKH50081.1 photosystem II assembly protein [Phormidium tenue NIES-30]